VNTLTLLIYFAFAIILAKIELTCSREETCNTLFVFQWASCQ
jgi:hypothetical protein